MWDAYLISQQLEFFLDSCVEIDIAFAPLTPVSQWFSSIMRKLSVRNKWVRSIDISFQSVRHTTTEDASSNTIFRLPSVKSLSIIWSDPESKILPDDLKDVLHSIFTPLVNLAHLHTNIPFTVAWWSPSQLHPLLKSITLDSWPIPNVICTPIIVTWAIYLLDGKVLQGLERILVETGPIGLPESKAWEVLQKSCIARKVALSRSVKWTATDHRSKRPNVENTEDPARGEFDL